MSQFLLLFSADGPASFPVVILAPDENLAKKNSSSYCREIWPATPRDYQIGNHLWEVFK